MITQARVQELFNYDPETGILSNKTSRAWNSKKGQVVGFNNGRYLQASIDGKQYLVHRICFLYYHGRLPKVVDHKDNDSLNNRILNIREATQQQNQFNSKVGINNKSGVKGVSWHSKANKWYSRLDIDGKSIYLGIFTDIEDARKAVEDARAKYHGEFANNG